MDGLTEFKEKMDCEALMEYTKSFDKHRKKTSYFTEKVASGYTILGNFMMCVSNMMDTMYPGFHFHIDHQFHISTKKHYADIALSTLRVSAASRASKAILVIEYKPKVAADLVDQEISDITESVLQALYLRKTSCHQILYCLTDLSDFHYFLMEDSTKTIEDSEVCGKEMEHRSYRRTTFPFKVFERQYTIPIS